MLYYCLLIITMGISIFFSLGPIENLNLILYIIASIPILLTTMYGIIKYKKTSFHKLILLTYLYYLIMLFFTMHQTISSFYILIPLTLVPIITSKIVKHIGLANRMAFSFWIVLIGIMVSMELALLKPYVLSFDVLLSFFLTSLTIHTNEIETFSANAPVWHSGRGTFPIFNPERVSHIKNDENPH